MKYPVVLQHNEEDCGAACVASIAKYYGHIFALNRIRDAVGTGSRGTTLLGLKQGAEFLGFKARGLKVSPEYLLKLQELPLPIIIHWQGHHWVVLYGQRRRKYIIADPAIGIRFLSEDEIVEGWKDWVTLIIEPDPLRILEEPEDSASGLRRFVKRVLPYRALLSEVTLCALVVGVLSLTFPFLIQFLTDDVLIRGDSQLLTSVVLAVVLMQGISSGLKLVQRNLIVHFAQRLELGLVLDFGQKILHLPLSYYEARRSGEIASRLQDIQQINQLISQIVVTLPSKFFIAVVSICLMLFYSERLTIVAILISVLMSTSTLLFMPTLRRKIRNLLVLDAENQGVLVEIFKGALTLKTTTAANQFWDELQSRFNQLASITFRTIQIDILNSTFSEFVSVSGSIILLWFGSRLVIDNKLTIGQLLAFSTMNGNFTSLIKTSISFIDEWFRAQTAVQRLTEVIDFPDEIENDSQKPLVNLSPQADIVCCDLNFYYPGRVNLLEDLNLTIPGGQVTALIGPSGCGKSSLAKLIAGLYPLNSGNIRFGIYNLQDLSIEDLRKQVALVPQEAHFWNRSILENFCLGYPQVTFEKIVRACQIAEADIFISELPNKYQTILGEFGANISGGQRQRLAIARAIVTEPPVLILDESTSGLDPGSEFRLLNRLLRHRHNKTTILISHRPTVINRADWIIFLEEGKLQIQGSLEKLRLQSGKHLEFLLPFAQLTETYPEKQTDSPCAKRNN